VKYQGLDRPVTLFGKKKRASTLLLKELFRSLPIDAEKHDTIIRCIVTPTGIWKETRKGRFTTLDQIVLEILRSRYRIGKRIIVADLAASSGITSVEFYKVLISAFPVDFIATDIWCEAISIQARRLNWTVVVDPNGNPLQYVVGRFVLPAQGGESYFYPVNIALMYLCRQFIWPKAFSIFEKYHPCEHNYFKTTTIEGYKLTKLPLLSFECMELMQSCANFRFELRDIMEPFPYRVDVIRALNIITPSHFDEGHLRIAIRNCINALNPAGLLILGWDSAGTFAEVKATVYLRQERNLEVIRTINGGCGIEHLVDKVSSKLIKL